jgi:putative peptidoglycan lipid II flippase
MSSILEQSSEMGRHAFSTMTSTSFGVVSGVVLDMIVVATFGMSWQTDAYFIAVTIPLVVITLMMLQATRVVQPLFIKKWETDSESESWSYLNLIITGGTVIVAVLSLVGVALSPLLARLQAAGLPHDAVLLTTRLSVYLFLIMPLNFSVVVMCAALQSLGIFALPGLTKFFETCFKILSLLLLGRTLGVESLVWGTLAGVLFQILVCSLALRRKGFRFRPIWAFGHPDMTQAYRLMIFPLAGQACAVGVESMTNALGSFLGPGNVTAIRLATRIIESFAGLLAGSIIVAAMPTVIASVANGDFEATRKHLRHGLYMLLLVTVPFSGWLALTNRSLIALLYERGGFSRTDTALVANILLLLIPYVFTGRFRSLLELPFFAAQDTRTPLLGSMTTAVFVVAFSFVFVRGFGVYGIPVGRSLAYVIGACFMEFLLRRRMGPIGFGALWSSLRKIVVASLVMAISVWCGNLLAAVLPLSGIDAKVVSLALPSTIGLAALLISLLKLGMITPSMAGIVSLKFARRIG